jgi:pimeloyl-ACP methyl ester carboxylesterase
VATYVLVHGAWHGSWEWDEVARILEGEGHRVIAVDLPRTTLDDNVATVRAAVEAVPEPVLLVGRSAGGMWITQTAELVPERVAKLVYVAAFLPADGQALNDLAAGDVAPSNLVVDEQTGTAVVAEAAHREGSYGECTDEVAAAASARRVPEALVQFSSPVRITEEGAGSVPRVYVECLRDRAIAIERQRAMQAARPCLQVLTIDTDHSPALSRPRELADRLLSLAA